MELSEQELVRRESLQKMRDLGINPYPADEYVVTGYSTDIKSTFVDIEGDEAKGESAPQNASVFGDPAEAKGEWYTGKPVRIAGRLMSRRIMARHRSLRFKTPKVVSKYM